MHNEALKRVVIFAAFCIAAACLFVNLARGSDLLYSAFSALCVMFAAALVLLGVFRGIGAILCGYLQEQAAPEEDSDDEQPPELQETPDSA